MKTFAATLVFLLLAVTALGLPTLLSGHHHSTCPLMTGHAVMCESSVLEHVSIWQLMLSALTLLGLLIVAFHPVSFRFVAARYTYSPRRGPPPRPSLMQYLYSRGILNRREMPGMHVY